MKKRFIAFALVVLILIPLIPKPVESKGFVKGIDVVYNDFKLQIEGKNISSKEPFIYDGELWVPLQNLGKALGMGIDFNFEKRDFKLNSNGKLNINDSSEANVAFQRGYEIQAKERIIGDLDKEIRAFEGKSTSATSSTESVVKNITVGFSNINLYLDGKKINLDIDPLIYDNDLYVSLIALSPLLYITPSLKGNLVNIDSNAVLVKKDGYNSVDDLAKFRDSLNNRLGIQLAEMEKRKEVLMDVKIPYEEIKTLTALEKYLNKHLGEIEDLPIDISLRAGSNSSYYVDIDFSTRHNYRWRELSRRDVEAHVWDIFIAISTLYDEDAKVQGNIKKYVTFDTKMKDIVFSFINSGLDISGKVDPVFIEELLKKVLGRYNGEYFDYSARMSGYDLDLIVTPSSRDYIDRWSPNRQLNFLEIINKEIRRYYPELKVNGKVVYGDLDPIFFVIENNQVRSDSLMGDTAEYLQDRFGTLSTGGLRIPMKYSLNQVDPDNFKLMVYMDFLVSDPKWNDQASNDLADLMDDVLRFILDMWDTNIFVQVYDKSQALAYEYIISQDTVHMVKANPNGGKVVEGSTITLSTSTPNAKIYYTLDGSRPNENSNLYSKPIVISTDTTINAFATREGFKDSPISTFIYTVTDDSNMASGLDSLEVEDYRISPSFNRQEANYTVTVPYGVDRVNVIAKAPAGSITINGNPVTSGDSESISINSETTVVDIVHSESDKSKDRTYTITIKSGDQVDSDVKLVVDDFITEIYGIFSGKLTGNYAGHSVRLLSDGGKLYKTATVDSNGEFEIDGFPIDAITQRLGYRYEVWNSGGDIVDKGNLQ